MAYNSVQFLGFSINTMPAADADPTNPFQLKYLGNANSKIDVSKRCQVMMDAVRAAAKSVTIAGSNTLKIFMAPEFFFRGDGGAYPIEEVSTILPRLRQWTHSSAYKDWLFVFGSALGYLTDGKAKEIFNVALIQRGGTEADDKDNARLVFKEYISRVDFIRPKAYTGKACPNCNTMVYANDFTNWDINRPDHRLALANTPDQRMSVLRPTQGSRDHLSKNTNAPGRGKENSASGLGGGGHFTMAGIRFGLEVCLDHFKGRLKASPPAAGEDYPQIHLIPSAGINITQASVACANQGIIFNVDGGGHIQLAQNTGTYDVPNVNSWAWLFPPNTVGWADAKLVQPRNDGADYFVGGGGMVYISYVANLPPTVPAPP
ncbi:hypothetical protein OV208_11545 [Corallococcus sp. bb12-1]|uniref:hypothetical protein n=1 Tax=Corallococcus sp. bb12-1 TaxID=2996784 RepID=UPI00226FCDB0|nr:hypothetical protein [Corallococcus sp. bb12-1]MCY1041949.1 hypothetical protein [Corallococcus sp. bb12-1]